MVNLSARELSKDVIESCRSGDREGFRALYDFYKDRVYSISLYFFQGDSATASDVTQQVFLKLMTSIHQFRGNAEFSTWLYRLVVNACMDTARSRKLQSWAAGRFSLEGFTAPGSQEEDYRPGADSGVRKERGFSLAPEVPHRGAAAVFRRPLLRGNGESAQLFDGNRGLKAEPPHRTVRQAVGTLWDAKTIFPAS